MARKWRLLDLFCKAGGAGMGYHRAGFEVIGVDIEPQKRYPFQFVQADALRPPFDLRDFDAIHASPPCQLYSRAAFQERHKIKHPDLLDPTRQILSQVLCPWVIENVDGAPLAKGSIRLCGLMFDLKVFRHRFFECSDMIFVPNHPSHKGKLIGKDGMCCVVGHGGGVSRRMRDQSARLNRHGSGGQQNKEEWEAAMGIDWMTRNDLSQAIPPAYTEFIGKQLIAILERRHADHQ